MVEQILLNNNEKCYRNFSQKLLKSKQGLSMPCLVRWTCTLIFTRLKTICYYKIQKSIIISFVKISPCLLPSTFPALQMLHRLGIYLRPCLVPQFGEDQITVWHCSNLFLFGNNCSNID
jgi:hypothetical protein